MCAVLVSVECCTSTVHGRVYCCRKPTPVLCCYHLLFIQVLPPNATAPCKYSPLQLQLCTVIAPYSYIPYSNSSYSYNPVVTDTTITTLSSYSSLQFQTSAFAPTIYSKQCSLVLHNDGDIPALS